MENKKLLTYLSVLIEVMAGIVGIVSQKINSIQQEADDQQSKSQAEYFNARGQEGVENQKILEDLMMLTEAKSQYSIMDTSSLNLDELQLEVGIEQALLDPKLIQNEIELFYLQGNQIFEEEWAQDSLLNLCFRDLLQCEVELSTLYGTDNTDEAIEISFSLNGDEELDRYIQEASTLENEYDGYYSPYMYVDNGVDELVLQFPFYTNKDISSYSGKELLWYNVGYSYLIEYINDWISEYNYLTDVCETNLNFANDWVSTHKNNAASAERIWLTNQQIADTYYANGNISMGDNISEMADEWLENRNQLMALANENKSLAHDWETRLYENTTQLYTYETWLSDEENIISSEHSVLLSEISKITAQLNSQKEKEIKIVELQTIISNSDILMTTLITNTTAFDLGLITASSPVIDSDNQSKYQEMMHYNSLEAYVKAENFDDQSRKVTERLDTLSTSIVFLSMSNMILGVSAGMVKDKKMGIGGKGNVLLLSSVGAVLGVIGIILYFIS